MLKHGCVAAMKADRRQLARLHEDRPIPTEIVRRYHAAVGRGEHQRIVVRLAEAEPHPHFELSDAMRLERLDRAHRQRDVTATALGLRGLESQPARVCSRLRSIVIEPRWRSTAPQASAAISPRRAPLVNAKTPIGSSQCPLRASSTSAT